MNARWGKMTHVEVQDVYTNRITHLPQIETGHAAHPPGAEASSGHADEKTSPANHDGP